MKRRSPLSLSRIAKRFDIDLIRVFGSAARGDMHAHSDIDVAYQGRRALGYAQQSQLMRALSDLPEFSDREIDLVDLRCAPPLLAYSALREGIKRYGSERADEAFYRYAAKRYIDAKPFFNATAEYVHNKTSIKNTSPSKK